MTLEDGFGFYGILTDPKAGYEALAGTMVARGVRFIQLRMKEASRAEIADTARRMRPIITLPSLFIINDDPELARDIGADGVHLGQGDMPFEEARGIVGPDAIMGLSTHDPGQTREACAHGPDYIGVGPVFATPTKEVPDPVIGIQGMKEMLAAASVPAVAIGGIGPANIREVVNAGARNVCAVRAVNGSRDPGAVLDQLLAEIEGCR